MTILGETKKIPPGSKRTLLRIYLIIKCDQCGAESEQCNNVKLIRARVRHYCNVICHKEAMKRGGPADAARRETSRKKHGVEYAWSRPDVLKNNSLKSHSPNAESKRKKTNRKNLEDYAFRLKRGLVLYRSKMEIDFLSRLASCLNEVLVLQRHVNGWWIDAYSSKYDTYIQFDGVYWHSKPENVLRDKHQDEWFVENNLKLLRITDQEAKL